VLGRKGALTLSGAALATGSLIAGVSRNYGMLITGRSLQGIGSGGISAITDIIVTDIVPLRVRGKWFAFISVPWAVGTTFGPILSGALTKSGSWVKHQSLHTPDTGRLTVGSDGSLRSTG